MLEILGLIAVMWALAGLNCQAWIWSSVFAATLLGVTIFGSLSWWFLFPTWLIFIAVAALANMPGLRQSLYIDKVYKIFRQSLPQISQTEQEALDAGDVWWEGELFKGNPDWQQMLNMPKPTLSPEEQAFLDNQVETLCKMLDDWQITHEEYDLPKHVWDYMKQEGFLGLSIDKAYGGMGFSALAQSSVVTKISTRSISAAVNVMVPNALGPGELLYHYGTDAQKNHYLPRLAKGQEIPCFALTSSNAGSDAGSMEDFGVITNGIHDGKECIGIRLNWDKRYITLAPIGTLLGLAFKLYDPDRILGDQEELGITVCLIPTEHPGVEVGKRHFPLSMAFMNGPTRGKDVFIPLDWIVGGPDNIGKGWRMLMESLAMGRGISLPALGSAVGKMSCRFTGAYARIRKQFNLPIGRFEGVAEALARIGGKNYLLEAARVMTAGAIDQKISPAVVSAIAKYHMTEMSRAVMDDAMDVHAGKAIQLGPNNYIGRGYQAIPVSITVEGANILTRNLMIFGQGAMRCHPYIRKEIDAVNMQDSVEGKKLLDQLLFSHIGYLVRNFARTLWYGVTGGYLIRVPVKAKTTAYLRELSRMSAAFAFIADVSMLIIGADLKRKERLSARLGDVLSNLYLASAAIKYFHDHDCNTDDHPCLDWSIQTCLHNIQVAFDEFFANFPIPVLGRVLKRIVFPFKRAYANPPSDRIDNKVAEQMLQPSAFRDRVTNLCFQGNGVEDAVWQVEDAFLKVINADDAYKTLQQSIRDGKLEKMRTMELSLAAAKAAGILTETEINRIEAAEQAVAKACAVDEFTNEQLKGKSTTCKQTSKDVAKSIS